MARRKSTVTAIDTGPWTAVVGGTGHEYKTRAGAVGRLMNEVDHWIRWARFYDHAAVDELEDVRARIHDCHGDADWSFTIAGLPAHAGLRKP